MAMPPVVTVTDGFRHGVVTDDSHSDILDIQAIFLMVAMVAAVGVRLIIRFTTTHIPGLDDVFAVLAMIFGIGDTIAVSVATHKGIGKRLDLIGPAKAEEAAKAMYASTILYVMTVALAKISILIFLGRLTVTKAHLMAVRVVGLIVIVWTVPAIFGVAFQCGLPHPWDYIHGKCFDGRPFWYTIGAVDIITDLAMIALPAWIVWSLQMNVNKKIVVFIAFSFRALVITAAICRLAYLGEFLGNANRDPTWDILPYAYCTQCHAIFNVIVACIPALKPFMDRADSGMMAMSLNNRVPGTTYGHNANSYALHSMSKKSGSGINKASNNLSYGSGGRSGGSGNRSGNHHISNRIWRPDPVDNKTIISHGNGHKKADADSVDSNGSDKMIIRQTRDWNIKFDDEDRKRDDSRRHSPEVPYEQVVHAS